MLCHALGVAHGWKECPWEGAWARTFHKPAKSEDGTSTKEHNGKCDIPVLSGRMAIAGGGEGSDGPRLPIC